MNARAIELQTGNDGWARSGRDDDAVESHVLFAAARFRYFQRGGIHERGLALNVLNGTLFGELSEAAGEFFDDAFLQRAELDRGRSSAWRNSMPQAFDCSASSMSLAT